MQSCSLSVIIQILNGSCNKLFTIWVLGPYQEIQALGFPNSPCKLGLYEKPWACISWHGPCTQLVNSKYSPRAQLVNGYYHMPRFSLGGWPVGGGNNRLLFKNNMILFSLLFSGNFVGVQGFDGGDKVVIGGSPSLPTRENPACLCQIN